MDATSGAIHKVVDGGFCIGCGACAALDPRIQMKMDRYGKFEAKLPSNTQFTLNAEQACPFSGLGPNEDQIASEHFTDSEIRRDERIGLHLATYAGWVEEGEHRVQGSSGGIGTWLQRELLAKGLVDATIVVTPAAENGEQRLFSFSIAKTSDDVTRASKTRYFPVEMSSVIKHILDTPGRYAVIGTPCFVKALRLAARNQPTLAERLRFILGIVCGHLKSAAFSEALAWQCDVSPDRIESIDFRAKLEGRSASRYGVAIAGKRIGTDEPHSVTRPMEGLIGANWGHGLFKYKACDFCDDVLAETADAVVGDAWLPSYDADHRGTNVVIVRNREILQIVENARNDGRLYLDDISADAVAQSQAGGLRHRRGGLAFRLWLEDKAGRWRPSKRIEPSRKHLSPAMRRIHRMRVHLSQFSHDAFLQAKERRNFDHFERLMSPKLAKYEREVSPSLMRRAWNLLERVFDKLPLRVRSD